MAKLGEMLSVEDKLKLIHLKQRLVPKRPCANCRELGQEEDCPICGYKAQRENGGQPVHTQTVVARSEQE